MLSRMVEFVLALRDFLQFVFRLFVCLLVVYLQIVKKIYKDRSLFKTQILHISAQKIHVSKDTKDMLEFIDGYHLEFRGLVDVKV